MKARIADAWELGPHESAPFAYFERRLKYVEDVHMAKAMGGELPGEYDSDDYEVEEEEEQGEAGGSGLNAAEEATPQSAQHTAPPASETDVQP